MRRFGVEWFSSFVLQLTQEELVAFAQTPEAVDVVVWLYRRRDCPGAQDAHGRLVQALLIGWGAR